MTGRPGPDTLDALAALGTATIGEASSNGVRILHGRVRALAEPAPSVCGTALTVRCRPGDNLAIHLALAGARRDDILVVDYGGDTGTGPFGEIMAFAAQHAGLRGLVIDGAVRDRAAIVRMAFPVFCRGTAIPGTSKADRGEIGTACTIGGTKVASGDVVVCDGDAVVAFDPGAAEDILIAGRARLDAEARIMERLRAGETTCEIFDLG